MKNLKDKIVLITGGASGIGKIMGRIVLERGAELIIWDIDRKKMDSTIAELSPFGKVSGYIADVGDPVLIKSVAERVKSEHGTVDVLINNAGVVVGKHFHDHTQRDIEWTMNINALAPMYVTLEFLPDMLKLNSGHVCTIASSAGLVSNPRMSVYVASKWSAVGWSDSLRLEMQLMKKDIGVTTVTPFYINTGMFDGVKSRIPILDPEKVSRRIIRAIEKNRIFLSMPWSVHFVRLSQGLLPIALFDFVMGKVLRIYSAMDHFKGHQK
ncbi:MAG: SDR family oxidoreductase [Ignavibacteriaceae bacterium]